MDMALIPEFFLGNGSVQKCRLCSRLYLHPAAEDAAEKLLRLAEATP